MRVDAAIAEIAGRREGLVTHDELIALGLSRNAVRWRLRDGRLHRMFRGVYLVGHSIAPPLARERGALLAAGGEALISHRSAAVLWELLPPTEDGDVHVTVIARACANRPGIRVHRSATMQRQDWSRRHGIPVTSAARTLLDFAEDATSRELEAAFDEALIQKRTTRRQLRRVLARSPGRHGAAPLTALLERSRPPAFTRSSGERVLLALVHAGGLPEPQANVRRHGHELDLYWPGLNVELDAWDVHRDRVASDHIRDFELQAAGIRVLRVTGRQLAYEPEQTLVRIAQALAQLSLGSAPRSAAGR
jgi:hypothetical protein